MSGAVFDREAYGSVTRRGKQTVFILAIFFGALPVSARAEGPVIVTLGDSLTAGFGLAPEFGFVAQLQAWLDAAGVDAEIVNGSVSGDTTAGGLSRLDWVVGPEVDAVIVELGGNDLLRGLPPEAARDNLAQIMAKLDAKGVAALLAGLPAPTNYGADYKASFDAIFPDLAAEHGAVYYPDFLKVIRDAGVLGGSKLLQADGIHPNQDGVAKIVEDIGPVVVQLIKKVDASS